MNTPAKATLGIVAALAGAAALLLTNSKPAPAPMPLLAAPAVKTPALPSSSSPAVTPKILELSVAAPADVLVLAMLPGQDLVQPVPSAIASAIAANAAPRKTTGYEVRAKATWSGVGTVWVWQRATDHRVQATIQRATGHSQTPPVFLAKLPGTLSFSPATFP